VTRHPSYPNAKRLSGKKADKLPDIAWKDDPDELNYKAAGTFLSLFLPQPMVSACVSALRTVGTRQYNPHDLLRAARLKPAKASDVTYGQELAKVEAGELWSPVLLVAMYPRLIIADGYHRTSVAYDLDEQPVWARIVPCHNPEEGDS